MESAIIERRDKIITKLTLLWYELVNLDYHKDRDCHWYIEKVYSYGDPPKYFVRHYGYIVEEINIECSSLEEAHTTLIISLWRSFCDEYLWALDVLEDSSNEEDECNLERAKGIVKIFSKAFKFLQKFYDI